MLNQALVLFGSKDSDSSDNNFIWGRVMTANPVDEDGNKVKNPGSIMIYGAKGFSTGDCEQVVLVSRGIGGLYDLVPTDKATLVCTKMGTTIDKLPEPALAESRGARGNRGDASAKASARRQARNGAASLLSQTPAGAMTIQTPVSVNSDKPE